MHVVHSVGFAITIGFGWFYLMLGLGVPWDKNFQKYPKRIDWHFWDGPAWNLHMPYWKAFRDRQSSKPWNCDLVEVKPLAKGECPCRPLAHWFLDYGELEVFAYRQSTSRQLTTLCGLLECENCRHGQLDFHAPTKAFSLPTSVGHWRIEYWF